MKDIPTDRIEEIQDNLVDEIDKIFPTDRYRVKLTGKTLCTSRHSLSHP